MSLNSNISDKKSSSSQQQSKKKKENDIIKFDDEEMELFDDIANKELGMDNETLSDLKVLPESKDLSDGELDDLIDNKENKILTRDEEDTPSIMDTLKSTDEIGRLTNEQIEEKKKQYVDEKNNLIVWLAAKSTISLHVYAGNRDGKALWEEKTFRFNSINKRQEMALNLLASRVKTISVRNALISNKAMTSLTDEEREFLSLAPLMIEVAAYRLSEKEAKLRLGMSPEDFAKVQADEYSLALQVLVWRTQNIPYYKLGR